MTAAYPTDSTAAAPEPEEVPTFTRGQRAGLLLIAVAAYGVGLLAVRVIGILADIEHGGSLLNDPAGVVGLIKAALIAIAVGVVGTIAGRSIRPDVGVFAAAIALLAIRRSGGVTREVYLIAPTASTLWMMALEIAVLAGALMAVFALTRRWVAVGGLPDDAASDGVHVEREPVNQRWLAFATQGLVMLVLMSILCRTDERMQVTASLAIASLLAAMSTVRFIPATPSGYFWLAPLAIGAIAYVVTALTGTASLVIGEPGGYLSALARALPLDYASAGVAGSLYGYWVGRTMIPEDDRLTAPPPAPETTAPAVASNDPTP